MNVLPALAHHLNQHTQYKWELNDEWEENDDHDILNQFICTTINTPPIINIWQEDNTICIQSSSCEVVTIDLLDPDFLEKLHHIINNS